MDGNGSAPPGLDADSGTPPSTPSLKQNVHDIISSLGKDEQDTFLTLAMRVREEQSSSVGARPLWSILRAFASMDPENVKRCIDVYEEFVTPPACDQDSETLNSRRRPDAHPISQPACGNSVASFPSELGNDHIPIHSVGTSVGSAKAVDYRQPEPKVQLNYQLPFANSGYHQGEHEPRMGGTWIPDGGQMAHGSYNAVNAMDLRESNMLELEAPSLFQIHGNDQLDEYLQRINSTRNLDLHKAIDGLARFAKQIEQPDGYYERESSSMTVSQQTQIDMLLQRIVKLTPKICEPTLMSTLIWALGRLMQQGDKVSDMLTHVNQNIPVVIEAFTANDLPNIIWGLARVKLANQADGSYGAKVENLASILIVQIARRSSSMSSQGLANSIWAMAKLGIVGPAASHAAKRLAEEVLKRLQDSDEFSTQSLAMILWSFTKIQSGSIVVAENLCETIAIVSQSRVHEFRAQELSMTIYALAKILGTGMKGHKAQGREGRPVRMKKTTMAFVLNAITDAESRINQLSHQGISNIAWSLAELKMQNQNVAQSFIRAAAHACMGQMGALHPQTISNMAFALKMFDKALCDTAADFTVAACDEARRRMEQGNMSQGQLEWKDLSAILLLAARTDARASESVKVFASHLARLVVIHDWSIENHAFLNIAVGCGRLGVPTELAADMIRCLEFRIHQFNATDMRQWQQLCSHYPSFNY